MVLHVDSNTYSVSRQGLGDIPYLGLGHPTSGIYNVLLGETDLDEGLLFKQGDISYRFGDPFILGQRLTPNMVLYNGMVYYKSVISRTNTLCSYYSSGYNKGTAWDANRNYWGWSVLVDGATEVQSLNYVPSSGDMLFAGVSYGSLNIGQGYEKTWWVWNTSEQFMEACVSDTTPDDDSDWYTILANYNVPITTPHVIGHMIYFQRTATDQYMYDAIGYGVTYFQVEQCYFTMSKDFYDDGDLQYLFVGPGRGWNTYNLPGLKPITLYVGANYDTNMDEVFLDQTTVLDMQPDTGVVKLDTSQYVSVITTTHLWELGIDETTGYIAGSYQLANSSVPICFVAQWGELGGYSFLFKNLPTIMS